MHLSSQVYKLIVILIYIYIYIPIFNPRLFKKEQHPAICIEYMQIQCYVLVR